MIENINKVNICEINDKGPELTDPPDTKKLCVASHKSWGNLVTLQHGESGEKIAVNGKDLIVAITNAMNTNRR